MKKIYMIPATEIVEVKVAQHLLVNSEVELGDPGSANSAESRRGSNFWDDEDDYDEEY